MKNATHTPGDWQINGDQLISIHTDEGGDHETLIADIFTEHDWWKANARLLRAAPLLLNALDGLLIYAADVHSEDLGLDVYKEAKAALAYATGT